MNRAAAIVECLLDESRWVRYEALPKRIKDALWQYMVTDGGVEADEYDEHVRKFTYRLQAYAAEKVRRAWYGVGWKLGDEEPLHASDEKRIRAIERLWNAGKNRWPYIVGSGVSSFKEWASDEMNHGDGYHRAVAAIRRGEPVEFLFLKFMGQANEAQKAE